jgi:two-component system sensor histidine kinase ChvG
MTRALRLRLLAAAILLAAAPILFLGLSPLIAEKRNREAKERASAALQAIAVILPTLTDATAVRAQLEAAALRHQLRIMLLDGTQRLLYSADHSHRPQRTLDRINYGSAEAPTLQRLDSVRPPIDRRPEAQHLGSGLRAEPFCSEPLRAGNGPTVYVCGAALGVAPLGPGPGGRWLLIAEQVVRRALLVEPQVQLRVLTAYVVIVALLPVIWWLGWGFVRPLDKLRAQVQQHAAQPLSMPQVHVEGQGEIAELADAFNSLLRALAERVHQNEEFMANVAHEMKNPVAAIRAAAEALGRPEPMDEARARRLSRVLLQSSRKLDALVTRFLDLARAEAGLPNEERVAIFLPDLVGRLIEQLRADERYHTVRFEIDAQPLSVSGVPGRIESVFSNLLDNAASFAPARPGATEPPWVRVRIRRDPERPQAVIDVTDSGPGIAPEDLKHLFKRFFTRRPRGSGIGLMLSRSLVEAHGGSLLASSPPGQGATFTVRLPLLEAAAAAAAGRSGGFKPLSL